MIEETNDVNTEVRDDEEEGRSGKGGKGKSGSGGGIRLPPNKLKEIMSNWEHLDVAKVVARVAEFFSEIPARASANVVVNWAGMSRHGFAVVNHLISSGQEIAHFMRDRSVSHVKRLRTKYGVKVSPATGPTAVLGGAGPSIG